MNCSFNTTSLEGKVLKELLDCFVNPSFGVVTKKELELKYFKVLQDLGYISKNPQPYELVSKLKISRQKARNLLYETSMRMTNEKDLDAQLGELLMRKDILLDENKVSIEVYNPYLIDYLKGKMFELNLGITDSSFSSEIVRLSIESYGMLYEKYAPQKEKENVKNYLVSLGFKTTISLGNMLKGFMKSMGDKFLSEEGKEMAEQVYKDLRNLLAGIPIVNDVLDADLGEGLKELKDKIKNVMQK